MKLPTGDAHFCTLREDENGSFLPCDEAFGGLEQAHHCPDFNCSNTKESVQEDFRKFLHTSPVGVIASQYPDIAALMWILNEEGPAVTISDPDPAPVPPPPPPLEYTVLYLLPDGGVLPVPRQTVLFHRVLNYGLTLDFSTGREP